MLVPLDGSQLAESVLPVVVRFAQLSPASAVILVHIIEKDAPSSIHGDTHLKDVAAAEDYLAVVAERLSSLGVNVETHVHTVPQGDVPRCIAEHSSELDQDLVILCRHGSGGVRRFVFGSIAERVVMLGEIPVLLVDAAESAPDRTIGPSSLVVLLEDSPNALAAFDIATEIATLSDSRLCLLSAVPTLASISAEEAASGRLIPFATRHVLDLAAEESTAWLKDAVARLVASGVKASGKVERGDSASAVVRVARSVRADLVVLTSRNKAGLSAFWADDVTRKIAGAYEGVLLLIPSREER